jgi:hypothetical protein
MPFEEVGSLSSNWPSEETHERFIKFLELELSMMECASVGNVDPVVLAELNTLLEESFPRTRAYIEKKLGGGMSIEIFNELSAFAWAEARAEADADGRTQVAGTWTEGEIVQDINDCFEIAKDRCGL